MYPIELKRMPGTCCPEPSCDLVREADISCESCGASCVGCPIRPLQGYRAWWRDVLCKCTSISIASRGRALCRYERPYPELTHECSFEKCPKRKG